MPRPVNPHGEEVEADHLSCPKFALVHGFRMISIFTTCRTVVPHVIPRVCARRCHGFGRISAQDTYLIDEEEDLEDVEIVVKPECEPSMV